MTLKHTSHRGAGTEPTALLELAGHRLGVIGLTEPYNDTRSYERFFGLVALPPLELVRALAAQLRRDGADAVMLLSHLGLPADRELAAALQHEISLIVGAHTHDHLPSGERIGNVWIAQAGRYAEHVGRIELRWFDGRLEIESVSTLPVADDLEPSPRVLEAINAVERDIESSMSQVITTLTDAFDLSSSLECSVGNLMADALRAYIKADVALVTAGIAFARALPAGALTRGTLAEASPSTANPGVANMTGAQIPKLLEIGLDAKKAAERPHGLRGGAIGLIHASGLRWREDRFTIADVPLEPTRTYRVGSSDAALDAGFGFVDDSWGLDAQFDANVILADVLESYLHDHPDVQLQTGRLGPQDSILKTFS